MEEACSAEVEIIRSAIPQGRAGEVLVRDPNIKGVNPHRGGISGHVVKDPPSQQHAQPPPDSEGEESKTPYPSMPPRISADTQILTQEEVDEKPWKYIGYQGYSQFIASDNDFFVLRRFGAVSARVVLMLQDKVTQLEDELLLLDRKYTRREAEDVNNGTFREEEDDRNLVLERLNKALLRYSEFDHPKPKEDALIEDKDEFVLQQAELKRYPQPSAQNIRSLENWHWNHEYRAISPEESNYLKHKLDLFSVVPKEKTRLRRLLERSRRFRINRFWKDHEKSELPMYDKNVITYTSDERIDNFVTFVIILVGMGMLIAPMWILDFLSTNIEKLACITAFIVAFLGMISYASAARPYEVLAAVAGYSAVLMVFLQIGTSGPVV